jgi:hypothetical protein
MFAIMMMLDAWEQVTAKISSFTPSPIREAEWGPCTTSKTLVNVVNRATLRTITTRVILAIQRL